MASASALDFLTSLCIENDGPGGKVIRFGGRKIPENICKQSEILKGLLEHDGSASLLVPDSHFRAWLTLAAFPEATTPFIDGTNSLASNVRLVEASQFLQSGSTLANAAARAATQLRHAFRYDSLRIRIDDDNCVQTVTFPNCVLASPGPYLQAAIAALPPVTVAAAAAIVPHLTLCEALLLPAPFPAEALAHFLYITAGVLDLSPPRVPAYSPSSLLTITQQLAPLLDAGPRLRALHVPVSCMTALGPLLPYFGSLTRLCLTHAKTTYDELVYPAVISGADIASLLLHLAPSELRHLSIDAVLQPEREPDNLHRFLSYFTGLTSLRLSTPTAAVANMPHLESLFVTHVPQALPAIIHTSQQLATASRTHHVHISGSSDGVCTWFEDVTGSRECASSGSGAMDECTAVRADIPPVLTCGGVAEIEDGYGGCYASSALCCGYPFAGGGVSFVHDRATLSCVASDYVRLCVYEELAAAWAPPTPPSAGAGEHAPRSALSNSVPGQLEYRPEALGPRALSFLMPQVSTDVLACARELLLGSVANDVRVLCVLRACDAPPRSVGAVLRGGGVEGLPHDGVHGGGWVTARPSGVAHPICALEMLHYNSAPHCDHGAAWPGDLTELGLFHTLRLSTEVFPFFQGGCHGPRGMDGRRVQHAAESWAPQSSGHDLVQADVPCFTALQDLSVLHSCSSPPTACVQGAQLNLACISRLTALRTLSLQGVPAVCSAPSFLPPGLTALLLHGSDVLQAAAGFGPALLRLSGLQCLDVNVQLHVDPQLGPSEQAISRAFWGGLRPALLELPLHLGARVSLKLPVFLGSEGCLSPTMLGLIHETIEGHHDAAE